MNGRIRVVRRPTNAAPQGLPARLPEGETLLWQGSPDWRGLARRVLHVRKIAFYFSVLAAFCVLRAMAGGHPALFASAVALAVLGGIAIGLLCGFAWLSARTTVYTITDRRVVLRIGIALGMDINLPFKLVDGASVRVFPDGRADIPLLMSGPTTLGWITLWPHARPWRTRRVQPMLRSVPNGAEVGRLLSRALAASADQAVAVIDASPARARAPQGLAIAGAGD